MLRTPCSCLKGLRLPSICRPAHARCLSWLPHPATAGSPHPLAATIAGNLSPQWARRLFVTDEWTELRMPGLLQARTCPARDDPGEDGRGGSTTLALLGSEKHTFHRESGFTGDPWLVLCVGLAELFGVWRVCVFVFVDAQATHCPRAVMAGYIGWHRDHDGPGMGVSTNPASVIKVKNWPGAVLPLGVGLVLLLVLLLLVVLHLPSAPIPLYVRISVHLFDDGGPDHEKETRRTPRAV